MKIPVGMIAAQIPDFLFDVSKQFPRLTSRLMSSFACWTVQAPEDYERALVLGARPDRGQLTGVAMYPTAEPKSEVLELLRTLLVRVGMSDRPLVVVGSSSKQEEPYIIEAFAILRKRFPDLKMAIAPRWPDESVGPLVLLAKQCGLVSLLRSEASTGLPADPFHADLLIMDTIGELFALYQFATIAVVAGTFIHSAIRGHNIAEPAFFGKPVIVGPHMHDLRTLMADFEKVDAVVRVESVAELVPTLHRLLKDVDLCVEYGQRARAVARQGAGWLDRTIASVDEWLGPQ